MSDVKTINGPMRKDGTPLFNRRNVEFEVIRSGFVMGRGNYIVIYDKDILPISKKSIIIVEGIEHEITRVERLAKPLLNVVPSNHVALFTREQIKAKKIKVKI